MTWNRSWLKWVGILLCGFVWESGAGRGAENAGRNALAMEALSRLKDYDLEANPAVKKAVYRILDSLKGQAEYVTVVEQFELKEKVPELVELASKAPDASLRVKAIQNVYRFGGGDQVPAFLEQAGGEDRMRLIQALGLAGVREGVDVLEGWLGRAEAGPGVISEVIKALSQTEVGAKRFFSWIEGKELSEQISLTAGLVFQGVRWPEIRQVAMDRFPLPKGGNDQALPPLSDLLNLRGNGDKGREVFFRDQSACAQCHQVDGKGIDFGPGLSEIGSKLARQAIYEAILNPSAGISFGYEGWEIETREGEIIYGILVSSTEEVQTVKVPGGILVQVPASEVVRKEKQELSLMPNGLHQSMSLEDLVDLVEYLAGLRTRNVSVEQ